MLQTLAAGLLTGSAIGELALLRVAVQAVDVANPFDVAHCSHYKYRVR